MNTRIFINCLNFKLHDETLALITAKAEKLFQQGVFLSSVKITLEGDYSRNSTVEYTAALVLTLRSSEIIVTQNSDILLTAIDSALQEVRRELEAAGGITPVEKRSLAANLT